MLLDCAYALTDSDPVPDRVRNLASASYAQTLLSQAGNHLQSPVRDCSYVNAPLHGYISSISWHMLTSAIQSEWYLSGSVTLNKRKGRLP